MREFHCATAQTPKAALAGGYALAGLFLCIAAIMECFFGVDAEGKSPESIAAPLSSRAD